jgi:hypothetical protein
MERITILDTAGNPVSLDAIRSEDQHDHDGEDHTGHDHD